MLIERKIRTDIERSLKEYPVVGIVGSRQTGKTTLAKQIKSDLKAKTIYLDLELPSDLNKIRDAEIYLNQYSDNLVIIDEIQCQPSLFPLIRALVDKNRKAGRFLILGSASPQLKRQAAESLAGRIIYHELTVFDLQEVDYKKMHRLWLRGGYPKSFLAVSDKESMIWREAFIKTYLERDIPQLGIRIPAIQLRRFWTMIAHAQGQLWNASQMANNMGISAPTVRHYLDILDDTFVVRQLQPYYANIKKRLIKSPKVYIRDTGLLHSLLGNSTLDALYGHPSVGSSWEGFVIEQIIGILPRGWQFFFYRSSSGAEIDLLLMNNKKAAIAVEIKYSLSPQATKGFWSSYRDLNCRKGFIVYPGNETYPLEKDVFALPLKNITDIIK
jgi:predicted AAA+ superfamily ATPase